LGNDVQREVVMKMKRKSLEVERTEAQADAAKAEYQNMVFGAFREVESSLLATDRARERVGDLKRLSASAREGATVGWRDYVRGILEHLTFLDAQRQFNRADMLLAEGQVRLVVNVVPLSKALGGGWEIAEPSTTQPVAFNHEKGNVR
jgi:multidrug efflux system outer membrane protein